MPSMAGLDFEPGVFSIVLTVRISKAKLLFKAEYKAGGTVYDDDGSKRRNFSRGDE